MARIKITQEMLEAGGQVMTESGVNGTIAFASVHGVKLKPFSKGYSPLERAYRVMRKLEPTTT